jgi:hypothetical protein
MSVATRRSRNWRAAGPAIRTVAIEPLESRVLLASAIARPDHIVIVWEQDRACEALGDPNMPYFNELAAGGLVYANSHGITHPSQPNVIGMYSGSTHGVTDNTQGLTFPTQTNLAKILYDSGFSFISYAETLPSDGWQGHWNGAPPHPDLYVRYLNPSAMFTNHGTLPGGQPRPNAAVNKTFAAFSSIPTDNYASLPTVSLILPNAMHSTHGSNEAFPWAGSPDPVNNNLLRSWADTWLRDNLDAYVDWARNNNSLLVVTCDEEWYVGGSADEITTIVSGDPDLVVPGVNNANVNHYSLLRTIADMYGLPRIGASATAAPFETSAQGRLVPSAPHATAVTLTSSQNPSVAGLPVTFTATVKSYFGVPNGIVAFFDGANSFGTAPLNGSGIASVTTSGLSLGTHPITAVYAGNATFRASTSPILSQVVNAVPAQTTTTISSSSSPSVFGQDVTLTATVAPASGTGTPTGTVQFRIDGTPFGSPLPLVNGAASTSVATLDVGPHVVVATYSGDAGHAASGSSDFNQTVNPASTSTSLTSSANPAAPGHAVTFTATVHVTAPGSGTPAGLVTFKRGMTTLGTGLLDGNQKATFTTSSLPLGSHAITATYDGDARFVGSISPVLVQRISLSVNHEQTEDSSALRGFAGFTRSKTQLLDDLPASL